MNCLLHKLLDKVTCLLSICGLRSQVTQAELHCQFHALGAGVIEEVRVQRDKGFGFIRYNTHDEAALAIQMANGRLVRGKNMKVRILSFCIYTCTYLVGKLKVLLKLEV